MKLLSQLKVGQQGVVAEIPGNDSVSVRLLEMGITPGATVKLIGSAPLGDPLEIEIRGYHLSLRRQEAMLIHLAD